jgi:hypothetical protein
LDEPESSYTSRPLGPPKSFWSIPVVSWNVPF